MKANQSEARKRLFTAREWATATRLATVQFAFGKGDCSQNQMAASDHADAPPGAGRAVASGGTRVSRVVPGVSPGTGWAVSGCGRMALQAGTLVFRRDAENDPRDAGATKPDDRLTAL